MTTSDTPIDKPPAIWNPNAAACWCLLFTPAFGAFLHAQNADTLGRAEEAKANRIWFKISIAFLICILVSVLIPGIPDGIFRFAGLGLLFGWYFSVGKKQIIFVKSTWQDRYERKSWKQPLLIAFGCLVVSFIVSFALAVVAESIFDSK